MIDSRRAVVSAWIPFSPLFIAAWSVTWTGLRCLVAVERDFQSAFHRGMECNSVVAFKKQDACWE